MVRIYIKHTSRAFNSRMEAAEAIVRAIELFGHFEDPLPTTIEEVDGKFHYVRHFLPQEEMTLEEYLERKRQHQLPALFDNQKFVAFGERCYEEIVEGFQ